MIPHCSSLSTSVGMSHQLIRYMLKMVLEEIHPVNPKPTLYTSPCGKYTMHWEVDRVKYPAANEVAQFHIEYAGAHVIYEVKYGITGLEIFVSSHFVRGPKDFVPDEKVYLELVIPVHGYICWLNGEHQFPKAYVPEGEDYPIYSTKENNNPTYYLPPRI